MFVKNLTNSREKLLSEGYNVQRVEQGVGCHILGQLEMPCHRGTALLRAVDTRQPKLKKVELGYGILAHFAL